MRKITLLLFLITAPFAFAQSWSTGVVNLAADYTVQFDIDSGTGLVTMTMVGPMNVWLGVAPGVAAGNSMGNAGDDAVVYNSSGLQDRNMPAGTGTPSLDGMQDWSVSSNNTAGGVRTLVATRAINTGDSNDYVFPISETTFPLLWAKGSSLSFGYHGSTKGGATASTTLSVPTFEDTLTSINVYPNPASTTLNIDIPAQLEDGLTIEVYNVLGKRVLLQSINQLSTSLSISTWNDGVYLMKISSLKDGKSVTKRFVKI